MSKKQIILSKAKVEFEQRAKEQGESIQFNICVPHCGDISCQSSTTTTTTTVVTPPHKKRRLEQNSMSTQEEEEEESRPVVDGCGAFNTHYSTQSSPPPLPSTNCTEDVKMNPLPAPKYLPRSQWPSFPSSVTPSYPESTSNTSSHTGTRIYHYHSNPPVVVYPGSTHSYHHNHHSSTSLFMSTRSTETRLPSIISSEEPSSHMYTTDFSKMSSSNTTTTTARDNEKPLSNIASFLQSVSQTAQSSPQLMKSCVTSVPQTIGVQSVIPVAFNSNCNSHVVPPTSNNTCFPSNSSHHTEHSTKRQTTPPPKTTRRRSSSAAQNSVASAQENVGQQVLCCLVGCTNPVTNRLRFSLRCHGEGDFKSEMISKGMNKVCHYHYFADLYQFKKATKGGVNSGLNKKSTLSPKKPSNSQLGKRGRRSTCDVSFLSTTQQEEGSSTLPVTHNNSTKSTVVVSSASLAVTSQRCSTTPVKTEDANIFFNFVELNRKSNQQQRTIL